MNIARVKTLVGCKYVTVHPKKGYFLGHQQSRDKMDFIAEGREVAFLKRAGNFSVTKDTISSNNLRICEFGGLEWHGKLVTDLPIGVSGVGVWKPRDWQTPPFGERSKHNHIILSYDELLRRDGLIHADNHTYHVNVPKGKSLYITVKGDEFCDVTVDGDGHCTIMHCGSSLGTCIREGKGTGDAIRGGDGDGDAIRRGDGKGDARRTDYGDGDAIRGGDGDGDATRGNVGFGNAIKQGYGIGDAIRSGSGDGCAFHDGLGKGEATRIQSNYRGKGRAYNGVAGKVLHGVA